MGREGGRNGCKESHRAGKLGSNSIRLKRNKKQREGRKKNERGEVKFSHNVQGEDFPFLAGGSLFLI